MISEYVCMPAKEIFSWYHVVKWRFKIQYGFRMTKINIRDLPTAVNICEQVLREVEKQPQWSMAHVVMNPLAASLLHDHETTTEIYVITKGYGELCLGTPRTQWSVP